MHWATLGLFVDFLIRLVAGPGPSVLTQLARLPLACMKPQFTYGQPVCSQVVIAAMNKQDQELSTEYVCGKFRPGFQNSMKKMTVFFAKLQHRVDGQPLQQGVRDNDSIVQQIMQFRF